MVKQTKRVVKQTSVVKKLIIESRILYIKVYIYGFFCGMTNKSNNQVSHILNENLYGKSSPEKSANLK